MRIFLFSLSVCFTSITLVPANSLANDHCSAFMTMALGLDSPVVRMQDGKLIVDKTSPDFISQDGETKATIKTKYYVGDEEFNYPTVIQVQRNAISTTVSRRADSKVKLANADLAGFEARYLTANKGQCEMELNTAIYRSPSGELKRLIFDKKYCDQVREILAKRGAEPDGMKKLETCSEQLGDIQEAYNRRRTELLKDDVMMSDSATSMGTPFMSAEPQNGAGLMLGLMSLCTPQGWDGFVMNARQNILRGTPQAPAYKKKTGQ